MNSVLKERISKNRGRSHKCGWMVIAGLIIEVILAIVFRKDSWWLEVWSPVFADFLVALGVFGEIHFASEASKDEDKLQRESEEKVAELNTRAKEAEERSIQAQLELEKFKVPRSISVELRNRIVEQMKQFAPQEYTGRVSAGSDDAWNLWREIRLALELAGWKMVGPFSPIGQPPYGPPATIASAAMPGVMIWSPAIGWFDIRLKAVALAKALRDDGNGILAAPGSTANNHKIITVEIGPNPHLPASIYHGPDP